MRSVGKLVLEAMVCFLFILVWVDSRETIIKSKPTEKELNTISFVTAICIVGALFGSVIIWVM